MRFLYSILFLLLFSCASIKELKHDIKSVRKCSFKLAHIKKHMSMGEKDASMFSYVVETTINIENPTDNSINLGRYKFDLYENNRFLTHFKTNEKTIIGANGTTSLNVKIVINPSRAIGILLKKFSGQQIEYEVNGTFYLRVGDSEIPIRRRLYKFIG